MTNVDPEDPWFTILTVWNDAWPWAINNNGVVAGVTPYGVFIWQNGLTTTPFIIGGPFVLESMMVDINIRGDIVFTNAGLDRTYFFDADEMAVFEILASAALSVDINDADQVLIQVRTGEDSGAAPEAMIWQDGTLTSVGEMSDPPIRAKRINNLGHLAGVIDDGTTMKPALLAGDMLIELDQMEGRPPRISAMNDLDQIAYFRRNHLYDPKGEGFLWDDEYITVLNDLIRCYSVYEIRAINNCGEMLMAVSNAKPVSACREVFPFDGEGIYSPGVGYRPISPLLENDLRWDQIHLVDLNDRGQIVGQITLEGGFGGRHGFLIAPNPGDFTLDGRIDLNDYARFFERFGKVTTDYSIYCNRADFDEDADTDLHDFAVFQNLFTGAP